MLLPSSQGSSIKQEILSLLDLESRFAGFNLLVFTPHASESEGSWRLSYEATKLSNNGGGNPIVSRSLTNEERKGGAMSNGIDGEGGDEWPKVRDATQSLGEVLKDDFERTGDPNPRRRSDEELTEELFGILSQYDEYTPHLEHISHLPSNRCHCEDPSSRFELRNTIHVTPFALSPKDTGIPKSAQQPWDSSWPRDAYGTMLSTVILIKWNGEVLFTERDIWGYGPDGTPVRTADHSTDRVFRFRLAIVPSL